MEEEEEGLAVAETVGFSADLPQLQSLLASTIYGNKKDFRNPHIRITTSMELTEQSSNCQNLRRYPSNFYLFIPFPFALHLRYNSAR
jgi:hypothetical protein